jgi:hypothetical protein
MSKDSYNSENVRVIESIITYINELLINPSLKDLDTTLSAILQNLEKIKNYYSIKDNIYRLMVPENIVLEGHLRRSRGVKTGGKRKTKSNRKERQKVIEKERQKVEKQKEK